MSAVVAALVGGRTHYSTLHNLLSSSALPTVSQNVDTVSQFGRKAPVQGLPSLGVSVPLKLRGAQSERLLSSTRGSPNYTLKLRCSVANADDFNLNDQHVEELPGGESKFVEAVSSHVDNNGTLAGSAPAGKSNVEKKKKVSGTQGMAEAFNISRGTALGIVTGTAFLALGVPLFMNSTSAALPIKTRVLSYLTLLFGFYMAWNIGANDVANAMGTSVGSGALSLRQAVLTAAVLEFGGAFLVGSHVSHTMQKGILQLSFFEGRETLLFCGMLSSLAAAGTWLQVASFCGWPVSTTHCIVGALVGFGLIFGGTGAVYWKTLLRVVSSWVVSPLMGAAVSFVVYMCIRLFVYSAPNPGQAAATVAPLAVFLGVAALSVTAFPPQSTLLLTVAQALGLGAVGAVVINFVIQRQLGSLLGAFCALPSDEKGEKPRLSRSPMKVGGPTGTQLKVVYSIFGYLQVLSACFMSFAHGANDVANAIGPISAALTILHGTGLRGDVSLPTEVLAWGGFGIVAGLMVWGYRVIATIGKKITELTPTRGFAAEFAAASVVVVASRLGLPISATHTLVGAVMGVGFARGLNSVRGEVVREIVTSWLITIPVGAGLSVVYAFILSKLIPSIF
ncbi:hypothetical protein R1sor_014504 [Riccia sorocarpa]|uniref:Phosphate transporter n=1 Tax=Riccia sorocarpa TaxID=122646 RepID=A0ABD3HCR7_9MARC